MPMLSRAFKVLFMWLPLALLPAKTVANSENVWAVWKQEGVHAIMRHATAPGFGDPEHFTLGRCDTQRNLNETGRQEARALGETIRKQGIALSAVYSSQWCRCLDTAKELRLGKVQELPALNSLFRDRSHSENQTAALKKHIAALGPTEKMLYVTHQVNTTALTGVYPASGQIILFKLGQNGEIQVVGTINSD
jgi:phosphohistidine phosphatase SixA